MIRIILFLLLIALAAAGAAWMADQPGDLVLNWGGLRLTSKQPMYLLGLVVVAAMVAGVILRGLWKIPGHVRRGRRERRHARGRHAITQGLLAIGHGDSAGARAHAEVARRHAANDPLALLLHAQSAQLDGDRDGAQRAFRAMAEREDTRLLGLRGLFIEAQRADDPVAAVMIAEEALKMSPSSSWASHAVLGFCCAKGDWAGALSIIDNNQSAGLIDKATYRRQRGVLLTARALEFETVDRDLSRSSAMEAVKLAPTLIPAAVLAAKFESEAHQVRRAMRIVETAWLARPHPDLADAYSHVRLGDSARQRLVRVETLAAKTPGHIEGALAIARAAIDAAEFAKARAALEPFIAAPTQRVALLMAEIERTEHGDSGRARAWTLRAVRALHDPVWTADGYVSDRWRPVSPVTGRLDAFQWQTPVAALPSDKGHAIEPSPFEEAMLAPRRVEPPKELASEPVDAKPAEPAEIKPVEIKPLEPAAPTVQDNAPLPAAIEAEPAPAPAEPAAPAAESAPPAPAPLFRSRADLPKAAPAPIPAVIPIVRAPDDPGVDEDGPVDEFAEQIGPPKAQVGGWRGFLSRLGS
ncbi:MULTISPECIES: heme biosynthesis protein HemY [Bradyrhizobium]|jgi:HemY protein|uniref:heme biosynthesis protein HemY n=1 Tax=Bradyrhizobium TaxID=374 RepID=UPI0004878B01|nr:MULTISPECIES: heme biosynthesis HemY N-terminal domain-containing protein [Bradyrhizobium]MCS3444876.1 HemY protein [Bradyrhizobium elkanii]MCS3563996.1 HemY protein [Bradyrhizobium elkanii]MCW2146172.1 HemY protein [Bradyrhizobium elkanii]MCW2354755.1 HemY protein [Bradyrhizobium elkanii]MCW2378999.1 HemY protein [Bradyrhizobium elkanii]